MVEKMNHSIESTIETETKKELIELRNEVLKKTPNAKEKLSDKEKNEQKEQVKAFTDDMNELITNTGERYVKKNNKELSISEVIRSDSGVNYQLSLKKAGKVVFVYSFNADMFRKGNDVVMQCKVDGKTMDYASNTKTQKDVYDHYEVLAQAKKYMQEVESIIK